MKKTTYLIFAIIIAISVDSCKKDYPKDIPDWLEQRIKEEKRECKKDYNCVCKTLGYCLQITEWKEPISNQIIYEFCVSAALEPENFYDYYGNYICTANSGVGDTCGSFIVNTLVYQRLIWQQ